MYLLLEETDSGIVFRIASCLLIVIYGYIYLYDQHTTTHRHETIHAFNYSIIFYPNK